MLFPLDSRPAQCQSPDNSAQPVESILCSPFPGLVLRTQSPASAETTHPKIADNGSGKAITVGDEESKDPASRPGSVDGTSTSGSLKPSPVAQPGSSTEPTGIETERTQIDRSTVLSSVEQIRSNLIKLQTDFVLPELDHYGPPADDRDEIVSVPSVSSNEISRLIPYTSANRPVYKYEYELNGLSEQLDRIDSHGDVKVRERRKEVVKAVERALEGVERVVGEAVERRISLLGSVAEDIVGEAAPGPAVERVDTPTAVDDLVREQPARVHCMQESSRAEGSIPQPNAQVDYSDATTTPHVDPSPAGPDFGPSTSTTILGLMELDVTEPEPTALVARAEVPETMDVLLIPEKASQCSPVMKSQEVSSDTDDDVLVLDSDEEKSDWSEIDD